MYSLKLVLKGLLQMCRPCIFYCPLHKQVGNGLPTLVSKWELPFDNVKETVDILSCIIR